MNDQDLLKRLRDEVNMPVGDDERLQEKLEAAKEYVRSAIGGATVAEAVQADCVVSCAADLYNARDARLGVMNLTDSELQPFRVSTDPLRSVWPKLNAAGVATGGLVVA